MIQWTTLAKVSKGYFYVSAEKKNNSAFILSYFYVIYLIKGKKQLHVKNV